MSEIRLRGTPPDWAKFLQKGDCLAYVGPSLENRKIPWRFEAWDKDKLLCFAPDFMDDRSFDVIDMQLRYPTGQEAVTTNKQSYVGSRDAEHPPGPEGYVDGNPKTAAGARKPPTGAIPGTAILALGMAMQNGLEKYGLTNWREFPVTTSTYYNAAMRHMLEFNDGNTFDVHTGIHNLAHAMACFAIIIDAQCQGTITDDRTQFPGTVSDLINLISEGKANALREPR